jgi:serine/threonine protein kinase
MKAALYYIGWTLSERKNLFLLLNRDYKVNNIKEWNVLHWKHGVKYFKGKYGGVPVFIKVFGSIDTTAREIKAMQEAAARSSYLKEHIPELISTDMSKPHVLVEKFVPGKPMEQFVEQNTQDCDEIVSQIFKIYQELRDHGIRHLDIRPQNFMVTKDANGLKVVLIDFGYSLVDVDDVFWGLEKNAVTRGVLRKLGSKYACQGGEWDDAYSCLLTLKHVDSSLMRSRNDIWKSLNNDIGKYVVSMDEK